MLLTLVKKFHSISDDDNYSGKFNEKLENILCGKRKNIDSDLWNETHLNEMPLYFTTSFPDHRLARYSERANERGLLQSEEFYSNSGKLKKAIQYKYHKNNEAYIRSLQFNKLYLGSRVMDFDRVLKYISAYKIYITPCLLSEKIEIMHGDNQS